MTRRNRIETADPGVFVDLDARSRDVAIEALNASDAPIGQADGLVAAITGASLKMIVEARIGLHMAGHTPENDEMLPLLFLPLEAAQHALLAHGHVGITGKDRDLPLAEQQLAECAAYCMAAIDRIRLARGAS